MKKLRTIVINIFVLHLVFSLNIHSQSIKDSIIVANFLKSQLDHYLILEADSGHNEKVKLLLELGANPNTISWNNGVTPLMYASQAGHYQIVKELIAYNANLNAKNVNGLAALHYAAINNKDSIAELLILNGANPHPVNKSGVSPLHYSSAYGFPFMSYILLYYGAQIDSTDIYGNTPLMASVYSGAYATSDYLLENWADVDKPDRRGYTPLMIASQFNDTTMMRLLTDYGAEINKKNIFGITALALAIDRHADDAIAFLLLKGANIDEIHPKFSYADLALRNGYKDLAQFLNKLGSQISSKPALTSIVYNTGIIINQNDFYLVTEINSIISNYGVNASLDFGFRPFYKPIQVDDKYAVYQFFEQRNLVGLSLGKEIFRIRFKGKSYLNFSLGFGYLRSWAYYSIKSEVYKPKSYNLFTPNLNVNIFRKKLYMGVGTHYLLMDHLREQPLSFKFSIGYIVDRSNYKISPKHIEWF
jgi:ankyrin repeat protein